ncbi:TolC family protein [Planctomycetales bacterium ZRK34]|nr:TolC family protein [Planctomycetales bacterium ZRK34]
MRFKGLIILVVAVIAVSGCAPSDYRKDADQVVAGHIDAGQAEALGQTEPFTIQTPADTLRRRLLALQDLPISGPASYGTDALNKPEHWPEADQPARLPEGDTLVPPWPADQPVTLTLLEALQIGARNSREYQAQKEDVFRAALDLDLQIDDFRNTYTGLLESLLSHDRGDDTPTTGLQNTGSFSLSRQFESGAILTGRLIVDLAKLLSSDGQSSIGLAADASVTIPLLRGAGRHIVREPLTQAERSLIYQIWRFARFKRTFAVQVARDYLRVLQNLDTVENAQGNYERLIISARRARRLADAQRLSNLQVDQARQDELSARDNWISAQQNYEASLDSFKISLGLPTDAKVILDHSELQRLADASRKRLGSHAPTQQAKPEAVPFDAPIVLDEPSREDGGPYEMDPVEAIKLALDHRLDLRVSEGRVYDAQRAVVVAADALQMGLALTGTASAGERRSIGSAGSEDARLLPSRGFYTAGLEVDLPWERTAERNIYRDSYINLERATRNVQELEDSVKFDVRDGLRSLLEARQSYQINAMAVQLAERRVESTKLFLQAGRSEIRDVLEAESALLNAQNRLTAALVNYRVSELELQRDMGVLQVDPKGLWREYDVTQSN